MRKREKEWLNINGYENCDPTSNGEFNTIHKFLNKGDTFIDIGANLGLFSKEAINYTDGNVRIIAFEANEQLIENLKNALGAEAKILQVALGDENKKAMFGVNQLDSSSSSVFERTEMMPGFNQATSFVEVQMNKLDNYYELFEMNEQNSVFIKIDVEGSELSVLRGAEKILSGDNNRIIITFEYSFAWKEAGEKLKEAVHILDNNQFSIFRITPLGLERVRFFSIEMDNFLYCTYCAIKNINIDEYFQTSVSIPTNRGNAEIYLFDNNEFCE